MMIRNFIGVVVIFLLICSGKGLKAQVDTDLTEKTTILYTNLKIVQNSDNILFGQEFFNSFKYSSGSAHGDETYSDCHAVTGAYPVVLGSDFHYYLEKNSTERQYHTDAVKWAYQQGFVVTFDWHLSARNTTSYACTGAPTNLAKNIANNTGDDRAWYLGELDKVIAIINNDLVVGEEVIPIVFRPLHEMNGGWFWWGTCSGLSAAEYKSLYQLTVNYVKERTNNVLFCWSPNTPFNLDRYPGDDYVDIVGVDAYEVTVSSLRTELGKVVDYAREHDKIAVFSETGDRNSAANAGLYWKNTILPGIMEDPTGKSKKIAWMLTWINSSWSVPYVPHTGSAANVKQSFIDFKNSNRILFSDDSQNMYQPMVVLSAGEDEYKKQGFNIYPIPTRGEVTVDINDVSNAVTLTIVNSVGNTVYHTDVKDSKTLVRSEFLTIPGVYFVTVKDRYKSGTQKLIVY